MKATARISSLLVGISLLVLAGEGIAAADCPSSAIRWASSSRRIYVSGSGVTCTLSDLDTVAPSDALRLVDSTRKIWLLRAFVIIEKGASLLVRGTSAGGDANELRLLSNDSSSSTAQIYIRAQWGKITFDHTKVISWDESKSGPDTSPSSNKRAFVQARSFLDGGTARESRMDIKSSEIGWLGYNGSEAYGLSWKVIGTASSSLYAAVDVLGDVTDSHIHHNYFGAYTFGAFGMTWLRNEIDHNVQYGLDPHDDSDSLLIQDNEVHDNGNHGIICSQRCNDVTIRSNRVYDNKGCGIMIHRRVTDSILDDNDVFDNGDAGIAVFDSSGNEIRNNRISGNKRGIRLSVGAADNLFDGNEVEGTTQYAIYFYKGSDTPTSGDGHPKNNTFQENSIHDNAMVLKAGDADGNEFIGNTFAANSSGFEFTDSVGNVLSGNTIPSTTRISTFTSSSSKEASTIITNATGSLLVEAEGDATTTFRESSTRTHQVSGKSSNPIVTPGSSRLDLDSGDIGSARTVSALQLFATISSGTLRLTPGSWSTSGTGSKSWTAQSTSGTLNTTFRVGQLSSGTSYDVKRNGSTVATLTASSSGAITFNSSVGTSTVSFTVQVH